jgi:hypothetical protein
MGMINDKWETGFALITNFVFIIFGAIWTIASIYMYSDIPFGLGIIFVAIGAGSIILGIVKIFIIALGSLKTYRSSLKAKNKEDWIKDETQDN